VARTHDLDRKHMIEVFRRAHAHRGGSFVEIYENCNVFNDGAYDPILKRANRAEMMIDLVDGEPIVFGTDDQRCVTDDPAGGLRLADIAEVGTSAIAVHDEKASDPSFAFCLARLASDNFSPTPFGIFRDVEAAEYGEAVDHQLLTANEKAGPGELAALLESGATWEVS
jgi:2-oxoglutarate ferredoxin oxidoreductase subunit beta